jgi:hypothetical protein
VSIIHVEQQAMKDIMLAIQDALEDLKDQVSRLNVIGLASGDLEVESHCSGLHTRQGTSTGVLASIIRGLWYNEHPMIPMPIDMKYLKSLCDAAMGELPDKTNSSIGTTTLGTYIYRIDNDNSVHTPILLLLCQQNDRSMWQI